MEEKKKSLFEVLEPGQAFTVGILGGFMFICTIGFFILLALMLVGGSGLSLGSSTPTSESGKIAQTAGVNVKKLNKCIEKDEYSAKVQADQQGGAASGAQGTPFSILVGQNGETVSLNGAQPIDAVKQAIDSFLNPEGEIVSQGIAVPPVTDTDHVRGDAGAKVTIIEYSDFDCPYCSRFHTTMNQVVQQYSGQVRWVYRHFPLDNLHPDARAKAVASECAGEQGKFWEFADAAFAS